MEREKWRIMEENEMEETKGVISRIWKKKGNGVEGERWNRWEEIREGLGHESGLKALEMDV